MASICCRSLNALPLVDLPKIEMKSRETLIKDIKKLEKKTFPSTELFDFDSELKKHNTSLQVLVDFRSGSGLPDVVAYLVYAHTKRTVSLHKLCVREKYRNQGLATKMLKMLAEFSTSQGCLERIQLWVDAQRILARSLYAKTGFQEVAQVKDYYGPGRTGIKMVLDLLPL